MDISGKKESACVFSHASSMNLGMAVLVVRSVVGWIFNVVFDDIHVLLRMNCNLVIL